MAFCTLFNTAYLSRGLAMHASLTQHMPSAHLYVVCFDDRCFEVLTQLSLPKLTPIRLNDFEDSALLAVKPTRSVSEYCWTCTPSVIRYVMQHYQLTQCTYLDADVYFFNSPEAALILGEDHISITPHRYTPRYDQSVTSGIYCVQFMTFRNTEQGMKVLNWWRDRCIEWCYARSESGKFGDQKYLDDWPERFSGVKVLADPGLGVAPWNVQQYQVLPGGQAEILATHKTFDMVFYHFHACKVLTRKRFDLGGYCLNQAVISHVYQPYTKQLCQLEERLRHHGILDDVHGINLNRPAPLQKVKRFLKGTHNMIKLDKE